MAESALSELPHVSYIIHIHQVSTSRREFHPDEGFSEDDQQQQQKLRRQQLEHHPLAPPPPEIPEETELPFDVQKWSNDYQYLAQAVYQADQDQSGKFMNLARLLDGVKTY